MKGSGPKGFDSMFWFWGRSTSAVPHSRKGAETRRIDLCAGSRHLSPPYRRGVLDRAESSLYNPPAHLARNRGSGAQVAQLVEHATENRSVGGSIPPLGTISLSQSVS